AGTANRRKYGIDGCKFFLALIDMRYKIPATPQLKKNRIAVVFLVQCIRAHFITHAANSLYQLIRQKTLTEKVI
ncbi:MAG: hypothetical protein ABJC98_08660, partial [Bacteroidota bacterium]